MENGTRIYFSIEKRFYLKISVIKWNFLKKNAKSLTWNKMESETLKNIIKSREIIAFLSSVLCAFHYSTSTVWINPTKILRSHHFPPSPATCPNRRQKRRWCYMKIDKSESKELCSRKNFWYFYRFDVACAALMQWTDYSIILMDAFVSKTHSQLCGRQCIRTGEKVHRGFRPTGACTISLAALQSFERSLQSDLERRKRTEARRNKNIVQKTNGESYTHECN